MYSLHETSNALWLTGSETHQYTKQLNYAYLKCCSDPQTARTLGHCSAPNPQLTAATVSINNRKKGLNFSTMHQESVLVHHVNPSHTISLESTTDIPIRDSTSRIFGM